VLRKTNITFIIVLSYEQYIFKRSMNLDIIIPTLNEKENLEALIPYLKKNISDSTNIYIVDSIESTNDMSNFFNDSNIHFIKSKCARRSIQMNEGASLGNGNVLLFLHADVRPPLKFEQFIQQELTKGYRMGFFSYKFDQSTLLMKINEYFTKYNGVFAGGGDQCQFFTRELFNTYKGYKNDLEIMEDFDMINRLRKNNEPYTIIKNPAIVSSRKYKKNSYFKVNLINFITFMKFKNNVCQKEIKAFYKKSLN